MDLPGDNDLSLFHGNICDAVQSTPEMDVMSTFIRVLYSLSFKETCDISGVDTTCIYMWENRKDSLLGATIGYTNRLQKLEHKSLRQVLSVVL